MDGRVKVADSVRRKWKAVDFKCKYNKRGQDKGVYLEDRVRTNVLAKESEKSGKRMGEV